MSHFTNPSQVLLRNEAALIADSILVINFEQDMFLSQLASINPNSKITAYTSNFANAAWAKSVSNIDIVLDAQLPTSSPDLIIYYYPKAKPEALMCLDNIAAISHENTRLLIVGDNKGGVKSAEKQLKGKAQFCHKIDSARHCSLYQFVGLTLQDSFLLTDYQKTFQVTIADTTIDVISMPGVFNHGELDHGTALLLKTMTTPDAGTVLDFGCGAGIISAYFGKKNPKLEFICIDVSAFATTATELTLAANNIKGVTLLSNGLSELKDKVNHIVTNPPFHTGLNTDYQITETFIKEAKRFMQPNGSLNLVANSFLKYQPFLEQEFGSYTQTAKNNKFTVYYAKS